MRAISHPVGKTVLSRGLEKGNRGETEEGRVGGWAIEGREVKVV